MNPRRIWALILRQVFVMLRSWSRVADLFYWPLLDLLFFGFLSVYLVQREGTPMILGLFLGALILWDIFFRVQQGISVSFLMELWTRNFLNLFVTPLTVPEFLAAMMLWGLIKIAITMTLMTGLAFVLYNFNLFTLGFSLLPLIAGLIIFAWAVGTIVTAIILRYGQGAEVLAWGMAFFFQPFGAVFYPVTLYPRWLAQAVMVLPLPHIFEGMRAVFAGRPFPTADLVWAFVLDFLYLGLAFAFFGYMFQLARRRGLLLKAQD